MPEYLSPGVYIEETSFRGKPIEGVSTSTAGLVGVSRKGREGRPTLVTSFTQFVRQFGTPLSAPAPEKLGSYLGHAVRAFFDNGGKRAYIVRVLGAGAAASESTVQRGTVLRLPPTTTVRGGTGVRTLTLNSLRGVAPGGTIRVFTRPSPAGAWTEQAPVTVATIDAARSAVTLTADIPSGTTLDPGNTYFLVPAALPVADAMAPKFTARDRGAAGDSVAVAIRPVDLPPVRLSTRSFRRTQPSFANVATNGGGTTVDIPQSAMRFVRQGDTVQLRAGATLSPQVTLGAVPNVQVSFNLGAGARVNYPGTTRLFLRTRGAFNPAAPGQDTTQTLAGVAVDTTAMAGAGPFNANFAHAAAALFTAGDVWRLDDGGGNTLDLTVNSVNFPATTTVPLGAPVGAGFSPSTLVLINTPGRLLVEDVTGLTVPARTPAANESIAVLSAGKVATDTVALVDAGTRAIWMPATGGTFPSADVTDANWQTVESLALPSGASPALPVATTAPFYIGAVVEIDDGVGARQYTTVSAVDAIARTVTVNGTVTALADVAADPAQRRSFLRVLEIEVQVFEEGTLKETFSNLTWNPDPTLPSFSRYYVKRVSDPDNGSVLVTVTAGATAITSPDPTNQPTTDDGFPEALAGGSDGADPVATDIIGADNGPGKRTGIESLKERDDISIVAVPGVTDEAVQGALITHCELLKYRFAVLDGKIGKSDITEILAHRNNYDSKYAGYYAPWLETLDLSTGNTLLVPPSGHVIGIYARSDTERGVHKAPANEVVRGISDVEFPFTTGEQDVLNPVGVNLIREFTGRGIRVWGARTISSDQEWKYVNVRRLFIFLEHSIDRGTQWVVFEPNNEALWSRVRETIESFLVGVWKTGALMGTKPEEAFFVRCDRSTMTQDDIDNGRLVVLIGVSPTMPAEFVIFRIGQFTATTQA